LIELPLRLFFVENLERVALGLRYCLQFVEVGFHFPGFELSFVGHLVDPSFLIKIKNIKNVLTIIFNSK
jgi:hypothetical protein